MEEKKKSVFETLSVIDCSEHIEMKNGLSYLSWAWAWHICKKNYPDATYNVYERENGIPYFTDGKTCWVKTGVTIEGLEYIEYLPIMDYNNRSIFLDKVTSMDMNKAIQRSLTKALARHGLGLYVYAGSDLPEKEIDPEEVKRGIMQKIPGILTLEESKKIWEEEIKRNFSEDTPQFKELKDALAKKNREIKERDEAAKAKKTRKVAQPVPAEDMPSDGLEAFNFDQIK